VTEGANPTLEHRLKRLMLFRVVMVTTLLLSAIAVESVSETLLDANPLYLLIIATYGLTIVYVVALRWFGPREGLAYAQVVLDLFVVTGLVYLTSGTGSRLGFLLLYPMSVLSGSVLLSRRRALYSAFTAASLYAVMLWAVRMGWLQPQGPSDIPWVQARSLVYLVFLTGLSCLTVALIGSYLAEAVRRADKKLVAAEEQVADLRVLNQVILDSIQSGLLTTDVSGRLLYANRFGAALLGKSQSELRGQLLREVFESPRLDERVLPASVKHGPWRRFEIAYRHPDGRDVDVGISVSPLATTEPTPGGFLLVFQDLTEIKRLEREIVMKEKLAAVGEMAAALAHEIRNPLGSISGSAQVLMSEPSISKEQGQLLAIITRESTRLSDTLGHFLGQARPGSSARAPVDVGALIGEAVTLLRNAPEVGLGHRVEFKAEPGAHLCLADADQLVQVFWNLARNGLEAMPGGGVLLVTLARRGEDVVLGFSDQGRGIGREEQRRIFEPFHSGTPTGTGLGLAIVYRIVREHRGDISVRSLPGAGTHFEVRLPLVAAADQLQASGVPA